MPRMPRIPRMPRMPRMPRVRRMPGPPKPHKPLVCAQAPAFSGSEFTIWLTGMFQAYFALPPRFGCRLIGTTSAISVAAASLSLCWKESARPL